MQKQKTENELDILLPESEVIINGEVIEIKPFPFAKLPKVIELLTKMGVGIYELFKNGGLNFTEAGDVIINQAFLENIGKVIEDHFSEIVELMAIYTGKTSDFYNKNEFNGEDGILILVQIIERNYDFFMKRLAPIIQRISAKAMKK